jgi:exonuclease SbcD
MKAVICGDVHFGCVHGLGKQKPNGGNTRYDDYANTMNYIVEYCKENNVDVFIQTGDLFEDRDPPPEVLSLADDFLKNLSNAGIPSFVIMGNHDYKRRGDTFTSAISSLPARNYPGVNFILNPKVCSIENVSGTETLDLVLLPFRDKRMFDGDTLPQKCKVFEDNINKLIMERKNKGPVIAIGHNFFYEGSYNDYGGRELLVNPSSLKGLNAIFMGHLHSSRILKNGSTKAIYTGSMERNNFGEAKEQKNFIIYDSKYDEITFHTPPMRNLIEIKKDLSNLDVSNVFSGITDLIDKHDLTNSITRLSVDIKEELIPTLSKSKLKKYIYEKGAFFVSKINLMPVRNRVIRDTSILENDDDFSMFESFLKNQKIEAKELDLLLKDAKFVMEK